MHVAGFTCPSCDVPLRVRDRHFVGKTIRCPDCGQDLRIVESDSGEIQGIADEPAAVREARPSLRWPGPAAIGWAVAGCVALGLGWFLLPESAHNGTSLVPAVPNEQIAAGTRDHDELGRDAENSPATVADQLRALVAPMRAEIGNFDPFPAGTVHQQDLPAAERFSWIAAIVAAADPASIQPAWDRPWNDPVNSRFVRRQQSAWLNPLINDLVSDDRYPATHFVGVAGVGDDAATLPAKHRRSGVFGVDRRVSRDDIGDGLANTMLVAGVEERLGSWAAGGVATVRSFTGEPYIGGRDGFGTRDDGGMHVLMADGSVRFVSRETDPVVIRRMATMNDGLPLDPQVPDHPVDSKVEPPAVVFDQHLPEGDETAQADSSVPAVPVEGAARLIAELARPRDVPIDVLLAEPVVTYDVDALLRQRILEFSQQDPVPARELFRLVEEMSAVPVHFDELPPERVRSLDEPITLSLSQTTIAHILQAMVDALDLTYEGRAEGIFVLEPADTVPPVPSQ